jgi:uncharacterized protein YkwD
LPYCDPVADWPDEWVDFELEVVDLVNDRRGAGADCPTGNFGPTGPVELDPALVCSARVHSMDMYVRDFWGHTNPDGEEPWDRMEKAGYLWGGAGENIAAGQGTPEAAMEAWMNSTSGHCDNIMSPDWVHIGVGYFPDGGPYWTQNFARPR